MIEMFHNYLPGQLTEKDIQFLEELRLTDQNRYNSLYNFAIEEIVGLDQWDKPFCDCHNIDYSNPVANHTIERIMLAFLEKQSEHSANNHSNTLR